MDRADSGGQTATSPTDAAQVLSDQLPLLFLSSARASTSTHAEARSGRAQGLVKVLVKVLVAGR